MNCKIKKTLFAICPLMLILFSSCLPPPVDFEALMVFPPELAEQHGEWLLGGGVAINPPKITIEDLRGDSHYILRIYTDIDIPIKVSIKFDNDLGKKGINPAPEYIGDWITIPATLEVPPRTLVEFPLMIVVPSMASMPHNVEFYIVLTDTTRVGGPFILTMAYTFIIK